MNGFVRSMSTSFVVVDAMGKLTLGLYRRQNRVCEATIKFQHYGHSTTFNAHARAHRGRDFGHLWEASRALHREGEWR